MSSVSPVTPSDSIDSLRCLVSEAKCEVKQAERAILKDLDEAFLREDTSNDDDLYWVDKGFDAVAAVRARLLKGEQTIMTQRAQEIVDKRSGFTPTSTADQNPREGEHSMPRVGNVVEEIEDYAGDFELGDDEVLEVRLLAFFPCPLPHISLDT
jgi:hypothetical protein